MDSRGLTIIILVSVLAFTFIKRCNGQTTVPPPASAASTQPPGAPGAAATPPPGAGTTPPPGNVTTPPPGAGTTPPPGAGTTPPPGNVTTPPPGAGTTPPPGAGTTPPPGAGTTPPPVAGTAPPPGAGTTPSPGNVTTPSDNATTPVGTTATSSDNATTPVGGSTPQASQAPGAADPMDATPKWDFEYTTLKKGKLCIKGNQDSITHCNKLKDELVQVKFHADRNLTKLEGGNCFYLSDGATTTVGTTPPPSNGTEHKGPLRCVYKAQFSNNEKTEAVRLHFFNNNDDPRGKGDVVLLVAYWGDAKQPQNVIETPLS